MKSQSRQITDAAEWAPLAASQATFFQRESHVLLRTNRSFFPPSHVIILYLVFFSPILSAAGTSGELRQLCSSSMLSQRTITTGPFGSFPVTCFPAPAATYPPPLSLTDF